MVTKGEETRTLILQLAMRQAAAVGLEGLSIGGLARELGMSKSGLFAHFNSKSALQVQVLTYASEGFIDEVVRPALRSERGVTRLRTLFYGWIAWHERQETGCIFVAAITELDDRHGPARTFLQGQQSDWLDLIATVVKTCIDTGQFRPDVDPPGFAREMYSIALMLNMTTRLLEERDARANADRTFEALVARSLP